MIGQKQDCEAYFDETMISVSLLMFLPGKFLTLYDHKKPLFQLLATVITKPESRFKLRRERLGGKVTRKGGGG